MKRKSFFNYLMAFACGILLALPLNGYAQQTVRGDVNGSGVEDIDDVNAVINIVLHKADPTAGADVNGDGAVDIDDLNIVINVMLGKTHDGTVETRTYAVNGVSFKMVAVEGGTFTMGATAEQSGSTSYGNEGPTHQVTLSNYCIGETEVTQELWQAVMGDNPSWCNGHRDVWPSSYFGTNLQRPVENMTWEECQTFIAELNQLTGETFRLPTEAEWEYAARGGKLSKGYKFAGSNYLPNVAWYADNAYRVGEVSPDYGTHAVATLLPNELGLYDMSGNVWEWCQDWYGDYSSEAQTNPTGPATGSVHVIRGGCWDYYATSCRVSRRSHSTPLLWRHGLRLAL